MADPHARDDLSSDRTGRRAERVMSTASGMVGACATLIGLVKVIEPRARLSHVDEYAGMTAVAFVISALLAYLTLRVRRPRVQAALEDIADTLFLLAMVSLAGIGLMFAYDLI